MSRETESDLIVINRNVRMMIHLFRITGDMIQKSNTLHEIIENEQT